MADIYGYEEDSDSDYIGDSQCDEYEESESSEHIDAEVEWGGLQTEIIGKHPLGVRDFEDVNCVESDHGHSINENDPDKNYSSDEDAVNSRVKFPQFNPKTDMKDVKFVKGLMFSTSTEFRRALRDYAIKNGKEIRWLRNSNDRLHAACGRDCTWEISVSKMHGESTLQIKELKGEHNCSRKYFNKLATSDWIASKYLQDIRAQPKMAINVLKAKVQKDWKVCPSDKQCYRARTLARKWNEGCDTDQYGRLYDYLNEVKRTNPDTTALIVTRNAPNGDKVFQRLYVCLGALKKGMREGCRNVIGMDGAHLRGTHKGQILVAIGLDANNQTYPFAYAIVEVENKDTWKWFLKLIGEDVGITNSHHWCFLTDKQKGLIPALEELYPNAEQRFCVWHMYSNFREKYKGLALKGLFYDAARMTTEPEFRKAMYDIKCADKGAEKWLSERNPCHWSKAFYRTTVKSDIQINNICESLNGTIKGAREEPILCLLESVRCLLMKRICVREKLSAKQSGKLAPNIQKMVDEHKIKACTCIPYESGRGEYQVDSTICSGRWEVKLDERTCGCRNWQLSGIPCPHAIAAIYHKRGNPEDYVDTCYHLETWKKTYENIIHPINGPELWERTTYPHPLPPFYQPQPGRPKGARNKSKDAPVYNKQKVGKKSVLCGNCGEWNHNARTCSKPTNLEHLRKNPPRWKDKAAAESARKAAKEAAASRPKNKGGRPKRKSTYDTVPPPPPSTTTSYAPSGYSGGGQTTTGPNTTGSRCFSYAPSGFNGGSQAPSASNTPPTPSDFVGPSQVSDAYTRPPSAPKSRPPRHASVARSGGAGSKRRRLPSLLEPQD